MKCLVLGCGPAGLIAARAIHDYTGEAPAILSKARKSELFGAQYLHAPIPGVCGWDHEGTLISYELLGDAAGYRRKVYGDAWRNRVSPEDLIGEHYAWDIRHAYDDLWEMYGDSVIDVDLRDVGSDYLREVIGKADFVVSSIPKPVLCYDGHTFSSQSVWAMGDAPERGQECPVRVSANTVVCNGDESPSWYRASNVFDYATVEWPESSKPPIPGVAEVRKPLSNNCSCNEDVIHVGRYGCWEKGVLSHQAYSDTLQALQVR